MRRKDTEITDSETMDNIINSVKCCRLGFCDEGIAYIVPMNFGFFSDEYKNKRVLYFHSSYEGRKIQLLKKAIANNLLIAFEMDTEPEIVGKDLACTYTAHFSSLMGLGKPSFIEEKQEKISALQLIMKQNTGKEEWTFSEKSIENVCIFQLEICQISAKEKK